MSLLGEPRRPQKETLQFSRYSETVATDDDLVPMNTMPASAPSATTWRTGARDERSTIIRAYNLPLEIRGAVATVRLASVLDSLADFVRALGEGRIRTYADVIERSK